MAQSFNTSLKNVAALYAELLQAKVTSTSIKKDIESNPYYPSLLSLSDTFSRYQIDNSAYQVSKDNFDELEAPFVAFVNMPGVGKDFVLVINITSEKVTYLYKSKKPQVLSKDEFLKRYQGIIWAGESFGHSGEANYSKKLKEEKLQKNKKIVWVAAFALLILLTIFININAGNVFAFTTIALIKCIGVAAAVLLLVYETDKSNAFVKNICSAGGKTNCDAVLDSKASKIMGVSWGEVGFFYFAATGLWLFFPGISFIIKQCGSPLQMYLQHHIFYSAFIINGV